MTPCDPAALQDLAARLDEATGPDWGLDAAIEGLLGEWADAPSIHIEAGFEGTRAEFLHQHSPRYTASLDACEALMRAVLPAEVGTTLALPALIKDGGEEGLAGCYLCFLHDGRVVDVKGVAPTAPLAWLKAVVAAVVARGGGG